MNVVKRLLPVGLLLFPLVGSAELQTSGPNSVASAAGFYTGLFFESNNIVHEHAGYVSLNLTRGRWLSGYVVVGGDFFRVSEPRVNNDGEVTLDLISGGWFHWRSRYTLHLQFDLTNGTDQVTGTLDNSHWDGNDTLPATWSAQVLANRDTFHSRTNPAPQAGTYTLVLPGGDGVNEPAGAGYASVRVNSSGDVRITGSLADGTPFSQSTTLAKDGRFPLYSPVYGDRGSLIGWVGFEDLPDSDLSGTLLWTRERLHWSWIYPNGFTNQIEAIGSAFVSHRNLNEALGITDGIATFSDGGLDQPVEDTFEVSSSRIRNTSGNRFSLAVSPSQGVFRGAFAEPGFSFGKLFRGAWLQKQSRGYGYFIGDNNESGLVILEPAP